MTAEGGGYAQTAVIDRRYNALSQLSLGSAGRLRAAIAAREFLHSARGIDELLFAGEKWMASGADTNLDVLLGRTGVINRTASAGDVGLVIFRMDVRFHGKRASNLPLSPQRASVRRWTCSGLKVVLGLLTEIF